MASLIKRFIIGALLLWVLVVIFVTGPFIVRAGASEDQIQARINRAVDELRELQRENDELKLVIQALNGGTPLNINRQAVNKPPKDYEIYRRRAEDGIRELWFYARSQLEKIEQPTVKHIQRGIYERQLSVMVHLDKMRLNDGYDAWRQQEAESLKSLVYERLRSLQNPADCQSAKKLICNLNKGCGYGCQIHHGTYCMIMALTLKRSLILKSTGWRYNPRGFEDVFLPVSNSCTVAPGAFQKYPTGDEVINVQLPIIDAINPRPNTLPLAVPESLVPRLEQLHGNPALWWISQILGFLQRPQAQTSDFLKAVEEQNNIKKPYVGLHVRRTDKIGTEAEFHGIEEYMMWASEYFDFYELNHGPLDTRRVYIASDDASVLKEARLKFPSYVFYGDQKISVSAAVKNRYSVESLRGVLADIHMLAQSDHIVCTLSSQVCRVALEMMQLRFPDASARFRSLDDIFYFGGQRDHNEEAIQDNVQPLADGEIEFKKGDTIGIAGNHWDGFSKGVNRRTRQTGLYPSFKTKDLVDAEHFDIFSKT